MIVVYIYVYKHYVMKRLLFLIAVIFLTSALFAQPKSDYEKYYEAKEAQAAQASQPVQQDTIVEKPVVKKNKPHTIFDKYEPEQTTVVYTTEDMDNDVNIYVVEPFSYSMFYSPFAFSLSFGYPYYGFGYPYYGYGYYDPWYYPYYGYGYGWGYPYCGYGYGYPYYGYGGGYYPQNGDRGHGMLGSHGYSSGYNSGGNSYYGNGNGSISSKSLGRSYSSRSSNSFTAQSKSQSSARSYTSPENKPKKSK